MPQLIGIHAFKLNRKDQDASLALDAGIIKMTFALGDFKFDEWTRRRTQKGEQSFPNPLTRAQSFCPMHQYW
jgi:hypothetical protein